MPKAKPKSLALAPNPAVTAIKIRATKLMKSYSELTVIDTPSFESASLAVKEAISIRKDLKALLDPEIKLAKADYDAKRKVFKDIDGIIEKVEDIVRDALETYARTQREAQAKLVEKAIDKGQDVKAAAIATKPFVPEVSGLSFTERWHGEVFDLKLFLKAILDDLVPPEAVEPNLVWLNTKARLLKSEDIGIPGAKGVKESSSTIRT